MPVFSAPVIVILFYDVSEKAMDEEQDVHYLEEYFKEQEKFVKMARERLSRMAENEDQVDGPGDDKDSTLDYAFLLLNAPSPRGLIRTVEADEKARTLQYKEFAKLHPGLNREGQNVDQIEKVVKKYDSMEKEVRDYFEECGKSAIILNIVFNGHGTEDGWLHFYEGEDVPMETFLKMLHNLDQSKDTAFPERIDVIFGQCYSHKYRHEEYKGIRVHKVTTDEKPKTKVIVNRDCFGVAITSSIHEGLNEHATSAETLSQYSMEGGVIQADETPNQDLSQATVDDETIEIT